MPLTVQQSDWLTWLLGAPAAPPSPQSPPRSGHSGGVVIQEVTIRIGVEPEPGVADLSARAGDHIRATELANGGASGEGSSQPSPQPPQVCVDDGTSHAED